jgi:hypothetical protein
MIELDAGHVGLFFVLAVSVATNVVGIWMLRHNLPELHKMVDDLREDFHALDKKKLTREFRTAKEETAVRLPGSHPVVKPE